MNDQPSKSGSNAAVIVVVLLLVVLVILPCGLAVVGGALFFTFAARSSAVGIEMQQAAEAHAAEAMEAQTQAIENMNKAIDAADKANAEFDASRLDPLAPQTSIPDAEKLVPGPLPPAP
jgi:hypothetical protein